MSDGTCCLCSQTVFVRSTKNFVYRSKDEGKNWEKQNWKMEKAGSEEEGPLKPRLVALGSSARKWVARARARARALMGSCSLVRARQV